MTSITLVTLNKDIQEIKLELHKISHLLQEDFELSSEVKQELKRARNEPLSGYINHTSVLKEFMP